MTKKCGSVLRVLRVQTTATLLNAAFFAPLLPLVPKPPKNYDFRTNGATHGRYSRSQ